MRLTEKQKKFIDYYIETGNASESSKRAGYKGDNLDVIGSKNLSLLNEYIEPRLKEIEQSRAYDLENIFIFWTEIIKDNQEKTSDRLRASELLAKSLGGFIIKVEQKEICTEWFI